MMRESTPRDSGINQGELLECHPLPRALSREHARCLSTRLVAGVGGGRHDHRVTVYYVLFLAGRGVRRR